MSVRVAIAGPEALNEIKTYEQVVGVDGECAWAQLCVAYRFLSGDTVTDTQWQAAMEDAKGARRPTAAAFRCRGPGLASPRSRPRKEPYKLPCPLRAVARLF